MPHAPLVDSTAVVTTDLVREGDLIAGKYRVERVLGLGGMGLVVAARHLGLDEPVAIKVLLPEVMQDSEAVARFEREARAAIKIKSEHVARVMDCGVLDGGAPYMVMEYLDGHDLEAVLASRGALDVELATSWVLQACEAMAAAHSIGIIHRDLKPANLFLTRNADGTDCVKVLDFGISKISGASSGKASFRTHAVIGTPLYMSPEQMVSSGDVDMRSDVWSIGAVLYEMLAARPAFAGTELPQVCASVMHSSPTPLGTLRPAIPQGLEAVVLQCLEKDRERRPPNVAVLAAALAPFAPAAMHACALRAARVLHAAGLSVPPSELLEPPQSGQMAVTSLPFPVSIPVQPATRRAHSPLALAAAALVLVIAIVLVAALVRSRREAAVTGTSAEARSTPIPTASSSQSRSEVAVLADTPASASGSSAAAAPRASARSSKASASASAATGAPAASAGTGKGLDLFNDVQ